MDKSLPNLGKNEEARESFVTAYKNARNFEFEVKSQVEIAKTFNGKDDDYEGAKEYFGKNQQKGTYASRKNGIRLCARFNGEKKRVKRRSTRIFPEIY